jgi:hypothetical protein
VIKKRAPTREKCVLLISPYLWNYSSNFKILKSLTQLCKWATQKYHPKQHTAYVLLVRSPQKMPTFSEILFFGKKPCSFRGSTPTAEHKWEKLCTNRY